MNIGVVSELSDVERFELMVKKNRLSNFWDFDSGNCDYEALEKSMGVMSGGQCVMARFFLSVWFRRDFDLIDAVSVLDEESICVITDWMVKPYWP